MAGSDSCWKYCSKIFPESETCYPPGFSIGSHAFRRAQIAKKRPETENYSILEVMTFHEVGGGSLNAYILARFTFICGQYRNVRFRKEFSHQKWGL